MKLTMKIMMSLNKIRFINYYLDNPDITIKELFDLLEIDNIKIFRNQQGGIAQFLIKTPCKENEILINKN
jgi:hypothetical protein